MFKIITNLFRSIVKKFSKTYSDDELREIIKTKGLHHIAIIPDAERRWARAKGLHPSEGHRVSFVILAPNLIEKLLNIGLPTITLWATSPENWKRSQEEMKNLTTYVGMFFERILPIAKKYNVKVIHLGRLDRISSFVRDKIVSVEKQTEQFNKHILNVGVDYGGRDEICRTYQKILNEKILPEKLTEQVFASFLDTANQPYPYPDLLVRVGGEMRLSGFMLWQLASTELYFTKTPFPDFNYQMLQQAIFEFGKRGRRFGGD